MDFLSRRALLSGAASAALAAAAAPALSAPALAQTPPSSAAAPPPPGAAPAAVRFSHEDVVARARELAGTPFEADAPQLPPELERLDYDTFRDIRFRPERSPLAGNSPFRMQMFHLGFLFKRPVTVNILRGGVPVPVPYSSQLFDYGGNKFDRPLPVNLGFAGFRLHYPLNDPRVFDELISFLGASYFRFLGRGDRYGLSARALSVGAGRPGEEFPFFREFWVEMPEANADRAVVHALVDSESLTGAYRFAIYPARETVIDVSATLFPRKAIASFGLAPLTSMYFSGENEPRRLNEDYRPELHDSDGLLIHSGTGEWIWRPLTNPRDIQISSFTETGLRGFGLMQRDRTFEHYQDLEAEYHLRPGYWVEPREGFGEGHVELIEIPTGDETNDNIVAVFVPKNAPQPGQTIRLGYRMSSIGGRSIQPGGYVLHTFLSEARARGSNEPYDPNVRRFILDFVGGELPYFENDPGKVQVMPSLSNGRIVRSYIRPNPETKGFRTGIDVEVPPGQSADLRVFLRAGNRALTETWVYPWRPA